MRWNSLKIGQETECKGFLWYPTGSNALGWRWLEWAAWKEEYVGYYFGWEFKCWVNK